MKSEILKRKLTSYTTLAGSILAAGVVNAQALYTDVNPDVIINLGDTYDLDLNNDGIVDYKIMGVKAATWQKIEIDNPTFDNTNEIAAYVSPYSYVYASLFSAGSMIDNNREFHFGYGYGYASEPYPFATLFISYTTGYTIGQWGSAVDGYCGLRFNINTQKHYGWVRLDVSATGNSATIKDYAYEATPDVGIAAGAGNVGVSLINNDEKINVTSSNGTIQISTQGIKLPLIATVQNLLGQEVKEFSINNEIQIENISDLPDQLYLVTIYIGAKAYSFKIAN